MRPYLEQRYDLEPATRPMEHSETLWLEYGHDLARLMLERED